MERVKVKPATGGDEQAHADVGSIRLWRLRIPVSDRVSQRDRSICTARVAPSRRMYTGACMVSALVSVIVDSAALVDILKSCDYTL